MPKTPSLNTVRNQFDAKLESARTLFDAVRVFAEGPQAGIVGNPPIYPGHAWRIVGLAFMQMAMAWEDMVESTFARFLAGAKSPSGYAPELRLSDAHNLDHSYQLMSGNPSHRRGTDYLTWVDWGEVIKLAKVFFVGGQPFGHLSLLERDRYADAVKIRNRVAHFSDKCRKDFLVVAKNHLGIQPNGKLPKGFTVGQLLATVGVRGFGNAAPNQYYFYHYHSLFQGMANKICPI